jgi:hypothetical protein
MMKNKNKKKVCIFLHDWDETYTEKVNGHNAHTRTCKWCGKKQAAVLVGFFTKQKWIGFEIFKRDYVCIYGDPGILKHL